MSKSAKKKALAEELLADVIASDDKPASSFKQPASSPTVDAARGKPPVLGTVQRLEAENKDLSDRIKQNDELHSRQVRQLLDDIEKRDRAAAEGSTFELTMPRSGRKVAFSVQNIPTDLIDVSKSNYRIQTFLDEISISDIHPSIRENGQQRPGIVRPTSDGRFELVDGSRRLFSAKLLSRDFLAMVGDIPDSDIADVSDIENLSKPLSYYEKAMSYREQIGQGDYKNWNQLRMALNISETQIRRYRSLSELDDLYVRILRSPSDMPLTYGDVIRDLEKKAKDEVRSCAVKLLESRSSNSADDHDYPSVIAALRESSKKKSAPAKPTRKPIVYACADGLQFKHSVSNRGASKLEFQGFSDDQVARIIDYINSEYSGKS